MFLISENWRALLGNVLESDVYLKMIKWLETEYKTKKIYPKPENVFAAINFVKPDNVKVVIIGQDPYHQPNQAHGLSFSVNDGVKLPPSLKNIFKELNSDLGHEPPKSGNLTKWAKQGVLLLNSVLTVEEGKPNSHKNIGWQLITNKIIEVLNNQNNKVVFLLWGANAKAFIPLINTDKHFILTASHPSPLSANVGGWFGNKCFSKTNEILNGLNINPIDWSL